jgi:hypothetical protein
MKWYHMKMTVISIVESPIFIINVMATTSTTLITTYLAAITVITEF